MERTSDEERVEEDRGGVDRESGRGESLAARGNTPTPGKAGPQGRTSP